MNHEIKHTDSNIVIAAKSFNVEALDPVWLYKNGIFSEEENNKKTSIAMVTQIVNENFKFDLFPDRLQFAINPNYKPSKKLINEKVKKLIKLIKDTNFIAAGINFIHHIIPSDGDLHSLSRNLFFNKKNEFLPDLNDDNISFGFEYSKDEIGTRLKFEARPLSVIKENNIMDALQFSYNFSMKIEQNDNHEKIFELLDKWHDARILSNKLTDRINLIG